MDGKNLIILGGGLTGIFGIVFLYLSIFVLRQTGKCDTEIIILSLLLLFSGVIGVLTGTLDDDYLTRFNHVFSFKLSVLAVLLLGSAVCFDRDILVPYFSRLGSFIGLNIQGNSNLYWVTVLLLAISVHLSLTGIHAEKNYGYDSYCIALSVTRLIFIFIVAIFFRDGFTESVSWNMNTYSYSVCFIIFMLAFEFIRNLGDSESILLLIGKTLLCIGAIFLFLLLVSLLGGIINWICNLAIFIPFILLIIGLFFMGNIEEYT